jgi:hypothetical protein
VRRVKLLIAGLLLAALALPAGTAADPQSQGILEARLRISPLHASLTLSKSTVKVGDRVVVEVVVSNLGTERVAHIDIGLAIAEESCVKLSGNTSRRRGVLRPDGSAALSWRLEVTGTQAVCSSIVMLAQVTAFDGAYGETITLESPAKILTIN